jgi:hypothetical protein
MAQPYSPEEIAHLEKLAETDKYARIWSRYNWWAEKNGYPKRSYETLRRKLYKLGYTLQPTSGRMPIWRWAEILGLAPRTISHWAKKGWLKSEKDGINRLVSEEAFKAFAKKHPDKLTRVDKTTLLWLLDSSKQVEKIKAETPSRIRYKIIDNHMGVTYKSMNQAIKLTHKGERTIRKSPRFTLIAK